MKTIASEAVTSSLRAGGSPSPHNEITRMNYAVSEFKSILESEPVRLPDCTEARDILLRVFLRNGFCIAAFQFGAVALPEEMESRLRVMVGKTVAILRLDGRYYCREA